MIKIWGRGTSLNVAWYERLSQQPGFRQHIMGPIA
jgi:hypothetical protein